MKLNIKRTVTGLGFMLVFVVVMGFAFLGSLAFLLSEPKVWIAAGIVVGAVLIGRRG